jgi:DNA-binding transcriptional ArsR family regulator
MKSLTDQQLDQIFHALSDTSRRKMLDLLKDNELNVSDVSKSFDMSFPAVLKHLNVLESAGLISQERNGRVKLCTFEPETLRDTLSWLNQYEAYWSAKLDSLGSLLKQNKRK